ncbi:ATP-dependent RNA helicase DDX56/DBP9 [Angomonas deanei]|nr:ATP-dependent RNA helicase DDX56/DBP9 [Angomonas deanei]EPY39727.1 ATP-dependent RNA helicase DDX56/DBP9 [Angomonas deanei]|eukprot:EPY28149.1 ATP-dependent RNA helicase DDX56/DBP9 [Angomonas deanei]
MDEADMIASHSENSLRIVQSILPSNIQVIFASATLTEALSTVKGQLLHNPVNISLTSQETADDEDNAEGPIVESKIVLKESKSSALKQYYLVANDICHHHTLLYALYRLKLIEGKTLIFVNGDEETYRLQHFLEMMGVGTLVYDSSLPLNVRLDTLRRFQSGQVTTLVCTDGTLEKAEELYTEASEKLAKEGKPSTGKKTARGKRPRTTDDEEENLPSALHRGVDFSDVKNVILFDGVDTNSSTSLSQYTHRIGRAGRAGKTGIAITFFTVPQARAHTKALREYVESKGNQLVPFKQMQRSEAAKLQYRVDTVLANVTRTSTRKLRVATVAAELNKSSYLSNHLGQKDSEALRNILKRSTRKVNVQKSVLEIPDYMKLKGAEGVKDYSYRVRLDQTRSTKFKKAARAPVKDPLKAVVSKLRGKQKK